MDAAAINWTLLVMERAMGIEPNAKCGQVAESTSSLWSAGVQ